ncbi:recombinase family protein [Nocardioides sp.]|uniref:recombinase family protein n=1 Tax=Nocardioides sp. TaxID=35761 RepID=UPI00378394AB
MTKRAVLYARLSVTTEDSVSIARQLEAGRDYCRAQGWQVVAEHVDDGVSASANRPEDRNGWQEVLAHPRGAYDVVLVWKVDRLARRALDFLNADAALQERGAAVAAVADPVDMTTPQGRGFATMLAVFAEMEAAAISARVAGARRYIIQDGRVAGGAPPFGYMHARNPNGKGKVLRKDPETIGFVIEAAARILRGASVRSVSDYLDEVAPRQGRKNSAAHWTITVTRRMLTNPVLAGMTLNNPGNKGKVRGSEVLRGKDGMPLIRKDLAILSVEEHRDLKDRLSNAEPYKARSESYLAGLVWCGHCDKKMYRNAKNISGKRVRVFQCQGKDGCGQQVTNLEDIVEDRFLEEFGNHHFIITREIPSDYDLTEINTQIADTAARMTADDADMEALMERMAALKETKRRAPEVSYSTEVSHETSGEQWRKDRRTALLNRCSGVRLVKGRVGRKFDQSRLSFMELTPMLGKHEVVRAMGIPWDESNARTVHIPVEPGDF